MQNIDQAAPIVCIKVQCQVLKNEYMPVFWHKNFYFIAIFLNIDANSTAGRYVFSQSVTTRYRAQRSNLFDGVPALFVTQLKKPHVLHAAFWRYENCLRAFLKRRNHGPSSCQSLGCQEFCTVRYTRSGCGIMMVTLPERSQIPVMPLGEPFGLAG